MDSLMDSCVLDNQGFQVLSKGASPPLNFTHNQPAQIEYIQIFIQSLQDKMVGIAFSEWEIHGVVCELVELRVSHGQCELLENPG